MRDPMRIVIGKKYKRNDTGAVVKVIDLRLAGTAIFAVTQDVNDGHTTIIQDKDLRPV